MKREHHLEPEDTFWKRYFYRVICRSDTKVGKLFDITLLSLILLSAFIIMMESIPIFDRRLHLAFIILEWIISLFFTAEYILRVSVVKQKKQFIFSFFGGFGFGGTFFSGNSIFGILSVIMNAID